jgi:uncharacterized protein (DUF1330 family)
VTCHTTRCWRSPAQRDVVVETDVSDPDRYEQYKAAGAAAVAAAGGRYLVRGGELDVFKGDWRPSRLVVLEFEDLAAARRLV